MEELEGNIKKFLTQIDTLLNDIETIKSQRNKLRLSLEEDKAKLQRKFIEQNTARLNVIKAEERRNEASEGSMELKTEAGCLSKIQKYTIGQMMKRGADVRVVKGIDGVKQLLAEIEVSQ